MPRIGFSTGALALGDFRKGIKLQRREDIQAIELSALREDELDGLIQRFRRSIFPNLVFDHSMHRADF